MIDRLDTGRVGLFKRRFLDRRNRRAVAFAGMVREQRSGADLVPIRRVADETGASVTSVNSSKEWLCHSKAAPGSAAIVRIEISEG